MSTSTERRQAPRTESSRPVRAVTFDGQWVEWCALCDLSATGARLRFPVAPLPVGCFLLHLTAHQVHVCDVVWSYGDTVGVKFRDPRPE